MGLEGWHCDVFPRWWGGGSLIEPRGGACIFGGLLLDKVLSDTYWRIGLWWVFRWEGYVVSRVILSGEV